MIKRLVYSFKDLALFQRAFRHKSACAGSSEESYERLEFVGDAVIGLVIAELLYQRFPGIQEGQLSRFRSLLVSEGALLALATEIGLVELIDVGDSVLASNPGVLPPSIIADVLEALVGAIYLDGGYEPARRQVSHWFSGLLEQLTLEDSGRAVDPKTRLQEWTQARDRSRPEYLVSQVEGPAHDRTYTIECLVNGQLLAIGSGGSKKAAAQDAAGKALIRLELDTQSEEFIGE